MKRFSVIVDSREQTPYVFDPQRVDVIRRALPAGDYSVDAFETRIAVERKSLEDLVGTLIRGRERFNEELIKLATYESACVVVEGSLTDILLHRYRSAAHPNAVFGSVMSVICDFTVPVYFCDDRQVACKFTEAFLWRSHQKARSLWKKAGPPAR